MARKSGRTVNDSAEIRRQGEKALPAGRPKRVVILSDAADLEKGPTRTRSVGGSTSKGLNTVLANQAFGAVWIPRDASEVERDRLYKAAAMALAEFKPRDGIEGMLAGQAFALHAGAMECLRLAMVPDQPLEAADRLRRQGANLSRAFLDVLAGFDRKRGKFGHQVVRIERVQIAPGGSAAIVGAVHTGKGGVDEGKSEGEPHAPAAQLAHDPPFGAVLPPLRGADPGRHALPVACDAERQVPDAWGR